VTWSNPPINACLEEARLMNWSVLLSTLVGGLLTLAGGVVRQYLTHRYTRTRDEARLIREKAELLIQELYAHRQWLDAHHYTVLFQQNDHTDPSPLDRAYGIQALYFPDLRQQLDAVSTAGVPLIRFTTAQARRQAQDPHAWAAGAEQHIAEQQPIYETYIRASDAAIAAVVAAVKKGRDS
jgi:hypothetical protein